MKKHDDASCQRYSPLAGIDRAPLPQYLREALLSVTPPYCFRYTAKNEAVDHDKAVICVATEERRAGGFLVQKSGT
jgi:hypothetical protein